MGRWAKDGPGVEGNRLSPTWEHAGAAGWGLRPDSLDRAAREVCSYRQIGYGRLLASSLSVSDHGCHWRFGAFPSPRGFCLLLAVLD